MSLKQTPEFPLADQPRFLLNSGSEMPVVGFGTRGLVGAEAECCVREALEAGYRLIDTSPEYGSERRIASALGRFGDAAEEIFLTTRVSPGANPYVATLRQLEALGVERLDLCLLQRPGPTISPVPYWEGMIEAKEDGLTSAIGVSGFSSRDIDLLIASSGTPPSVNQVEWSPFGHYPAMLEHAAERGVVIQAHSPLTRGRRLDDPLITELAARHARTPAEIMIRWAIQVGVAVVVKAAMAEHRRSNLDVFDFELSREEMHRMVSLNRGYSALGGLPYL